MSNLLKRMRTPRSNPLPDPPPLIEQDEDADSSSASSASSASTVVPRSRCGTSSPATTWHQFFEQELWLGGSSNQDAKYHAYLTSPEDPVKDPLFICHHGAGSCAMSFALLAAALKQRLPQAGILAVDARDHGFAPGSEDTDFSLTTLGQDLSNAIHLATERLGCKSLPSIVLVGHSLGGAVVTELAKQGILGSRLIGFAVIDVVEGSAMEALRSMQTYLANRPKAFSSVQVAIDWHVRSRTIRNPESASISTPPLLRETAPGRWTWRTDLSSTQAYWEDWFGGMSSKFLTGKAAKLLLLAGTDRLDKDLTIGQMQGKFQLQVIPEAGHFVQEDVPERTAEILAEFYHRNDRSTLILPPKVSDLIAQGKKV